MAELTVAVIGCGGAGNVHLACWSNLTGIRIVAVCDTDGDAAAKTAMQYQGVAAFVDFEDALGLGPFDIVDVCTPPDQHIASVTAALQAGSHVLCEKPLTLLPDDARTLVHLATENDRLLMPAFCHRFHAPILFLKDLLENDDLGRPTMFRCRFSGMRPEAGAKDKVGAVLDTAIHGIDLFRYLCGEVREISGHLSTVNPEVKVEDTAALLVQGVNGAIGTVEVSWSSPGGRNLVEVYGTAGACIVDYDTGIMRYLTADHPFWQEREESGPNRFERQIAHFADAVRGLQTPVVTGEDGVRAVELCAEVYGQQ